jgi:hypothetical protein
MERTRIADGRRIDVASRYRVRLHPTDLADVATRAGGADAVAARLAGEALAFARAHGYHLAGRPEIWLVADPVMARGEIEVDALRGGSPAAVASERGEEVVPESRPQPEAAMAAAVAAMAAPATGGPASAPAPGSGPTPALGGPASAPDPGTVQTGIRGDGSQTMVFRRPAPAVTRAVLRILHRDGPERTVEVDGTPLTIGRARDNVLVLADTRISRHHGRLQARRGTLVYTDLGSTNGSRVNGIRVDEIVLGEGDRLQVGDTVLVVEMLPG